MRDEIPEEYREAQARIDQGLEPFGDIPIEDRRRRYLDAISNDNADDERLVDPRVAAARIARASLARDYEIEPERFELLQARARRKANQAFAEVPWDADLEAMFVDLVHEPEGDVEMERMLQIEEQFLADEVIADSPRRELKRLRDQLPYLGEFTDQVRELILASKADDTEHGTRIGTQFNLSRATETLRDYMREFEPEHAEGLAAELIGYGLEVCIELEREEDVVYTQAHYSGRVWTRLERYRDREGLEPVVFQGERDQDAYELSVAASLFITFTSVRIPLWDLELKPARGDNQDLRTDIHLTEGGTRALEEFPTLLSLKTRPTKVPLFVRPRPLHDRTTGSWSSPYQPMPRKLFDEHETGNPERTELPPMYAQALERFQGQAYRLNLGTRFAGSGWRLTDYRDEERTNLFQLGSFFLECGAVWKKGDKGFVSSEDYAKEKEQRIEALCGGPLSVDTDRLSHAAFVRSCRSSKSDGER